MNQDRRQTIRRKFSLPCDLLKLPESADFAALLTQLLGQAGARLLNELHVLEDQLQAEFTLPANTYVSRAKGSRNIYPPIQHDRENSKVFELLSTKLDLLVQRAVYPTPEGSYELCLSTRGCSLELPDPPAAGARIGLHLLLPDHHHVVCLGVVQAHAGGCRIVFEEFAPGHQRHLNRFLLMPPTDHDQDERAFAQHAGLRPDSFPHKSGN